MKNRFIFLLLSGFLLVGCNIPTKKERKKESEVDGLEIIKVRNCEYVLWFNNYGSDMEHYEGCKNKEHEEL
jgi:hypothetical protein